MKAHTDVSMYANKSRLSSMLKSASHLLTKECSIPSCITPIHHEHSVAHWYIQSCPAAEYGALACKGKFIEIKREKRSCTGFISRVWRFESPQNTRNSGCMLRIARDVANRRLKFDCTVPGAAALSRCARNGTHRAHFIRVSKPLYLGGQAQRVRSNLASSAVPPTSKISESYVVSTSMCATDTRSVAVPV